MSTGLQENIKQIYLMFLGYPKHICYIRDNTTLHITGDDAMAIGERIHFFRNKCGMTQKQLGKLLGFPEKSADVRLAQYETGSRSPKADLTATLAKVLDVSPNALSVPDIDSYIGLMHTLFTLEDRYGLYVDEVDGEICLKVNVRKNRDAAELHQMLCAWRQAAAMLQAEEISQEDYDNWRYHYPEFDATQKRAKVMSQGLSDLLVETLKDGDSNNG